MDALFPLEVAKPTRYEEILAGNSRKGILFGKK